jgi:branched-chain amino acid transport system permease protein
VTRWRWSLVTLGIFYIVNAFAADIWNFQARSFPSVMSTYPGWIPGIGGDRFFEIAGGRVFAGNAVLFVAFGLMILALHLILNRTKIGLAFRAVSSNLESSSLTGINPGLTMQFGWALAAGVGTLSASLVAPILTLQPNMMAAVLIYSLAGAALGGLDSIGGAIIGGLIVGSIQSVGVTWLVVIQLGQDWASVLQLAVALLILLAVLLSRPSGLWGSTQVERV